VYLFTMPENAAYIQANLESAGRERLAFSLAEDGVRMPEPRGREIRDTVASLRLDAVLGAAFSLSRAQAQEAVRAGKVRLNHVETLRTDASVDEGALLSLRGIGRAKLTQIGSNTRKGRVGIVLFRYE
jgi:RNA-binding protein YlmH